MPKFSILRICAVIMAGSLAHDNSALGCSGGYSSNQDTQCSGSSQYGYSGFQCYQNAVPAQPAQSTMSQNCPGFSAWLTCSAGSYLYITTKEAPNLQTRVGYPYTVQTAIYTGLLDFLTHPGGQYEIVRYFEQRFPSSKFGTPQFVSETTLNLPMQNIIQWLLPGLVQSTTTLTPSSQYGRETISLYWDPTPNPNAHWYQNTVNNLLVDLIDPTRRPVLLDTKQILVYPTSSAISQVPLQPNSALNNTSFVGDPPRVAETITNAYPGGTTWVSIYAGSNSANATTITNTSTQAPTTDLVVSRMANLDVGNQISSKGSYTVQVLQSTVAYGVEKLRQDTFTVTPNYAVTAEVGLAK
jgi:hypothetical protein